MDFLNRLTIKTKMAFLFVLVLVFFGLLAFFSINGMNELTTYAIDKAAGFTADAQAMQKHIMSKTIIFIGAAILAFLLMAYFVSRSIFFNIFALKDTNAELQARADDMQSQVKQLKLTSDELQQQNGQLRLQCRQVEDANRLKSEFLANMSHDLRTPLNAVMVLTQVLISQAKDKLSRAELSYLKVIARNGKKLLSLINDILDLAKMESGRMDIASKRFFPDSAIATVIERLEILADEKGIVLGKEISANLPQIESDESRLDQILQNLIGNAIKFTKEGQVTVSACSDAQNIHIEISDTGIGIAEKEIPHIFEEFKQVDETKAREYEGTGLGLAIAYKATKMLGGSLTVESVLGKGSKFTLTLPIKLQTTIAEPEPFGAY